MKNKFIVYAVVPVALTVGFIGTNVAAAHGMFRSAANLTPEQIVAFQQTIFTKEAQVLGISEVELKADWALGKTFKQIIQDRKLDQTAIQARMKAAHEAELKLQLQALVSKGVITQAQADSRLKAMQSRMEQGGKGKAKGGRMNGMGMGHQMEDPIGL